MNPDGRIHYTFPSIGRVLKVDDVGKRVFRVAPFQWKGGDVDFSYSLALDRFKEFSKYTCQLISISKLGEFVLAPLKYNLNMSYNFTKEWNDGNWITEKEFVQYVTSNPEVKPELVYSGLHLL